MSAASAEVPRYSSQPVDLAGIAESHVSTEQVRANIVAAKQTMSANLDAYKELVNKLVADMVSLLETGAKIDVDKLIEGFAEDEKKTRAKRKFEEKQHSAAIRSVVARRPDLMAALSDLIKAQQDDYDRLAALYRDARWALMEARAEFLPSHPSGTIKGQATDIDAYLKERS